MEVLLAIIHKAESLAVLSPLLVAGGLGYLVLTWRREERLEREFLLSTINEHTKAVAGLQAALAALNARLGGKE